MASLQSTLRLYKYIILELHTNDGIDPFKLFEYKSNSLKLVNKLNEDGMLPVSWFSNNLKYAKFFIVSIVDGIVPLNDYYSCPKNTISSTIQR
jgi:hypothetical protein